LYYLRDRVGKATRLRERKLKAGESTNGDGKKGVAAPAETVAK
jgi:hypothetical protein